MPYSLGRPRKDLVERLRNKYPKLPKKDIRKFIHIFNGSQKAGDDESTSFAKAWGVLKRDHKKKKKAEIIRMMVKLANDLDSNGLSLEADLVDNLLFHFFE